MKNQLRAWLQKKISTIELAESEDGSDLLRYTIQKEDEGIVLRRESMWETEREVSFPSDHWDELIATLWQGEEAEEEAEALWELRVCFSCRSAAVLMRCLTGAVVGIHEKEVLLPATESVITLITTVLPPKAEKPAADVPKEKRHQIVVFRL